MQRDLLNSICILRNIYFGHDIYLNLSYLCNLQQILIEKWILVMLKKRKQLILGADNKRSVDKMQMKCVPT